jgi:type III pantothenate kinase
MNLCIDLGNSSIKIGIFDKEVPVLFSVYDVFGHLELHGLKVQYPIDACILSSVRTEDPEFTELLESLFPNLIILSHTTPVPVTIGYDTPQTLGKDRLAAVVAAEFLFSNRNVLVVDAGTAITFDFLDADKYYHGGNIAPGVGMRFRALHEFTHKLPLVEPENDVAELGVDTKSAIGAGVLWGMVYEIDGYIDRLKIKYPELLVLLTGGSTFYFVGKLKNPIFAEPNLVLIGLNRILQYNVQK